MPFLPKNIKTEQLLLILLITLVCVLIPVNIYIFVKKNTKIQSYPSQTKQPTTTDRSIKDSQITPLSDKKQQIITQLASSGYVYNAKTFSIEYLYAADVFQIEILSVDTEKAQEEAINWFKEHGLNQKEVCTIPIQMYPSFDVKNTLQELNKSFNPLPPGC